MPRVARALCWAAAIILLAIGNAAGLVEDKTASVLFIVLPLVAWLSIVGRRTCLSRPAEAIR